ncbi:MAG: glycosyltransferase [Candidatus Anstonellales archaeon]
MSQLSTKNKKIRVFYNLKPWYRGRQWDAATYAPECVQAVFPEVKKEEEGSKVRKPKFYSNLIPFNPLLINVKEFRHVNADLIYSFGGFVKNTKIPYVVEVDNPACFTYYSALAFHNPIVMGSMRKYLNDGKLARLLPMSMASKNGLLNAFGNHLEEKTEVVYPPLPDIPLSRDTSEDGPRFIFISYNFYIKGGREILKALEKVKGKYSFTMVSDIPEKFMPIARKRGIRIHKKVERGILLSKVLPLNDVVVHPTYIDSFGIAPYECINAGLAGIGTDMYAIPEFIEHGKNGFIFKSPVDYFNDKFLPNLKFWLFTGVEAYAKSHEFPEVVDRLAEYIQYYIDNPKEMKKHKKHSVKLHNEKFALNIYQKKLGKIFRDII